MHGAGNGVHGIGNNVYFTYQRQGYLQASLTEKPIALSLTAILGANIPIRPFLARQAFEPEIIRQMPIALETVCEKLELNLTDDSATRLVASRIIELAQRGVRDADTLRAMVLKEFGPPEPE